jgi:hypothetical protein
MLTIHWDPMDGESPPEGRVRERARQILKVSQEGDAEVRIGNTLLINEFRLFLKNEELGVKDVVFMYGQRQLQHYQNGRFSDWPSGFCDLMDEQLEQLLSPY